MKRLILLIITLILYIGWFVEKSNACQNFPCTDSDCIDTSGPTTFPLAYESTATGIIDGGGGGFIVDHWSISTQGKLGQVNIVGPSNLNQVHWSYQAGAGKCGVDCFALQATGTPEENYDVFAFCFQVTIQSPPFLIANPSSLITCANASKMGTVTASGFTTIDASNIRFAHYTGMGGGPSHGSLGISGIDPITGNFTYTPALNYTGPDSFIFTVTNTRTGQTNSNTVTITVNSHPTTSDFSFDSCVNSVAVAGLNVSGGTPAYTYIPNPASSKGVPINQPAGNSQPIITYQPSVTGGDFFFFSVEDAAGCISNVSTGNTNVAPSLVAGPVSFTACSGKNVTQSFSASGGHPGSYSFSIGTGSNAPKKGVVIINGGGTFTYTPFINATGIDTFSYFLGDGSCQVQSNIITVTINRTPQLVYQQSVSVCENGTLQNMVTDDSLAQQLTPSLISGPSHGSVSFNTPPVGFQYVYNPTAGYVGNDSFIFSAVNVTDPTCNATGPVNITVVPGPVAELVSVSGCAGVSITGVFAPTGGSGSYTNYMVTQPNPAHGQVVPNTQYPNFSYISTASFSGPDSFSYAVQDSNGCVSATGPVNVFVNKNAVGVPQSLTGCRNTSINGQLLATGGSGTFTFGITSSLVNNVLFTSAPIFLSQGVITAFNSTTGSFTYQFMAANPSIETFYFALIGCAQFALVPVQITPLASPTATPISFTTCEDGSYSGILAATGGSGSYNFTYSNGPNHGILNPFNATAGTFTYSPTAGFSGQDTFSYRAIDVSNGCASNQALATVTVSNVVAPTVQNLSINACEDGSVMSNFTASGGSGNYQYAVISGPTSGTLPLVNATTGEFIYQPVTNFSGIASFTYSATDITTGCVGNIGTVTIAVGCS